MTRIPKLQLEVDDFIEGELEYDDDGTYYGEDSTSIDYKKIKN